MALGAVNAVQAVTAPALRAVLGGLPEGKEHCADLAVDALARALRKGVPQLQGVPQTP